ncbi:MAG: hypothetical protein E6713_01590 [Sporomusaceae bacterium]|nr:hypothetical protein [Sporomusaceae bacterium]
MNKFCKFTIVAVALLQLFKIVEPNGLSVSLGIVSLLLFLTGFPTQGKSFQKMTLFFLACGAFLLWNYHLPLSIWLDSFISMTNVIAIIVVMQLFTLPISLGKYSDTIEYWLKKSFRKESGLFLFATLITHAFSSFLLFGTVPVMVALFSKAFKNTISDYPRFLSAAIVRGYAMALLWAPGAVIMLLVLQVTGASWFSLFLPSVLLSILGLTTAYVLEHFSGLNRPLTISAQQAAPSATKQTALRQSVHIAAVVLGLIGLIALFELGNIGAGSGRILLAGLTVSGIWLLSFWRQTGFRDALRTYWESGVTKAVDLSVFFLAMGFFAGAVEKSNILGQLQPLLQIYITQFGLLALLVIPCVFVLLAVVGIHPFILVVLFGKVLMALSLPLSPVGISLLLLLSSAISFIASPFAGMVLMTAKFLQVKNFDVAWRWNGLYSLIFFLEGLLFICLWP